LQGAGENLGLEKEKKRLQFAEKKKKGRHPPAEKKGGYRVPLCLWWREGFGKVWGWGENAPKKGEGTPVLLKGGKQFE